MSPKRPFLSPRLRNALVSSLTKQGIIFLFINIMGRLSPPMGIGKITLYAAAAFNTFILLVIVFRRHSPTRFDLIFIRRGHFPIIILAWLVAALTWKIQAY